MKSKAPGTLRNYLNAFNAFCSFAATHSVPPFPAHPVHVMLFLEALRAKELAAPTIASHLFGISWVHRIAGLPQPSEDPLCRAFLEGVKRTSSGALCHTIPAGPVVLSTLKAQAERSQRFVEYRSFLLALLSFAGCLRFAEAAALTFSDIEMSDDGLRIHLTQSKTDQHKLGHVLEIALTGSALCPHACYQHYLHLVPVKHFAPLHPVFFNFGAGTPVKRDTCVKLIRQMLTNNGFPNAKQLTMHSFRIGCASTLAGKGVDSLHIRELGRWNTNASFDRYVRPTTAHKQHISRALGL